MRSSHKRVEKATSADRTTDRSTRASNKPSRNTTHATDSLNGNHAIDSLQRSLGNQAVQELHRQEKRKGSTPTDKDAGRTDREPEPSDRESEGRGVSPDDTVELRSDIAESGEAIDDSAVESEETPAETDTLAEGDKQATPTTTAADGKTADSPTDDPAFRSLIDDIEHVATRERSHPPPQSATADAQLAAESPPVEITSEAATNQVDEMARQEPQPFESEPLRETLIQRIEESTPETLEEADEFTDSNNLGDVKRELDAEVDTKADQTQEPVEEKTREPPDTSAVEPKPTQPLEPPEPGSQPAAIGAERAAPKPKPAAEVSMPFEERRESLDQQFENDAISEEQLENANEPSFTRALDAKREAQTDAAVAPGKYRQSEQSIVADAQSEAGSVAGRNLTSMHGERVRLLDDVAGRQERTKDEDEQARAEIAADIQRIYEQTKERVTDRLDRLDQEVNERFDEGTAEARSAFESYVDERMRAYKEERYSGAAGKGRWLSDKVLGLPSRVEEFYREGRNLYLEKMNTTIDQVVGILSSGLREATEIIADGRQEINEYVASRPESLTAVAREAAGDIKQQFDELEGRVDDRKDQLIDSLARKYNENLQELDSRIEELKAENRGLVDKAFDAVAGVVQVITQLKNLLLSVLGKAAQAAVTIIQNPIGFLGNLVTGVKQGFEQFRANIWAHLQRGLLGWLTGAVESAGIQMPDRLDASGIFSIVMQVLGLTYDNIREQAVKVLGEATVSRLEKTFEIFQIMVTEGIVGLWEYVKTRLTALGERVLDEIRQLVITEVIQAGVKWLFSLLGPVGAFIKACKAIYDIVSFFVKRAQQVLKLVEAFLDSVLAIGRGSLGAVAGLIENALAGSISVLIGFLASLLGLSDLPRKVKAVIETVQKPINEAIQWVIGQAREAARKLGTALGIREEERAEPARDERSRAEKQQDLDTALDEAEAMVQDPNTSIEEARAALPAIQSAYGLSTLALQSEPGEHPNVIVSVEGKINPQEKRQYSKKDTEESSVRHSGYNVPYTVTGPHGKVQATTVYVLKDANGYVLYVGKGVDPLGRLRSHIKDPKKTEWFGEIAEIVVRGTGLTNTEALALEEELIDQLRPQHNVIQRPFGAEFGDTMQVGPNLPESQKPLQFKIEWGH